MTDAQRPGLRVIKGVESSEYEEMLKNVGDHQMATPMLLEPGIKVESLDEFVEHLFEHYNWIAEEIFKGEPDDEYEPIMAFITPEGFLIGPCTNFFDEEGKKKRLLFEEMIPQLIDALDASMFAIGSEVWTIEFNLDDIVDDPDSLTVEEKRDISERYQAGLMPSEHPMRIEQLGVTAMQGDPRRILGILADFAQIDGKKRVFSRAVRADTMEDESYEMKGLLIDEPMKALVKAAQERE